jgi:hypothetical protein
MIFILIELLIGGVNLAMGIYNIEAHIWARAFSFTVAGFWFGIAFDMAVQRIMQVD